MEVYGGICPVCQREYDECTCTEQDSQEPPHEVDGFLEDMGSINAEALYPTDLKDAIIGMVERYGTSPLILLDRNKCLNIFIERDGMTPDEAEEFFEFNVIGAWMGEGTPCFATLIE